ncbi:MAG: hypothetical protein WC655_13040 [Candidatus Hydrogenedentales bacterium]
MYRMNPPSEGAPKPLAALGEVAGWRSASARVGQMAFAWSYSEGMG